MQLTAVFHYPHDARLIRRQAIDDAFQAYASRTRRQTIRGRGLSSSSSMGHPRLTNADEQAMNREGGVRVWHFDHVPPPPCTPDESSTPPEKTGSALPHVTSHPPRHAAARAEVWERERLRAKCAPSPRAMFPPGCFERTGTDPAPLNERVRHSAAPVSTLCASSSATRGTASIQKRRIILRRDVIGERRRGVGGEAHRPQSTRISRPYGSALDCWPEVTLTSSPSHQCRPRQAQSWAMRNSGAHEMSPIAR